MAKPCPPSDSYQSGYNYIYSYTCEGVKSARIPHTCPLGLVVQSAIQSAMVGGEIRPTNPLWKLIHFKTKDHKCIL